MFSGGDLAPLHGQRLLEGVIEDRSLVELAKSARTIVPLLVSAWPGL